MELSQSEEMKFKYMRSSKEQHFMSAMKSKRFWFVKIDKKKFSRDFLKPH